MLTCLFTAAVEALELKATEGVPSALAVCTNNVQHKLLIHVRPRHGAKLPPPTSAGGLPKGSLPTSMEGEPSTDVVFGGFSDKVPPFALKKKRKQHCLPKMADASCQHGG